jgi:hypothetical protein
MGLTCNIDARGKRARLINGIIMIAVGVAIGIWAWIDQPFLWIMALVPLLIGGFCVFEARAGWCALRAMGIKTRL